MPEQRFWPVDLHEMAQQAGVDLGAAFERLQAIYDDVDNRNDALTQHLELPCHKGCSMCCHESVFVTPLEFFYAWHYVQQTLPDLERDAIIAQGLALYRQHQHLIDALDEPHAEGTDDHIDVARKIKFACPMLSAAGACRVYPARELLARLFGCSFNEQGGLYACHLVARHIKNRTVTLMRARPQWRRLLDLPLTHKRQVYPYYFNLLFGQKAA